MLLITKVMQHVSEEDMNVLDYWPFIQYLLGRVTYNDMSTSWRHQRMKSQRITKVIRIHSLGTIYTKFHGNSSNSCQDISKKKNIST